MGQLPESFQVEGVDDTYLVTCSHRLTSCADLWLRLEKTFACSPYQTYAYCQAWLSSRPESDAGFFAFLISNGAGVPVMFLPLAISDWHGARVARFIGDSHTNFSMPLFDPEHLPPPKMIRRIFSDIAETGAIDAFHLDKMPVTWRGTRNPLLALKHRSASSRAFHHTLGQNAEDTLRSMRSPSHLKQLRNKARKLGEMGRVAICEAVHPGERAEALKCFLKQKSAWCRATKRRDVFAGQDTSQFFSNLLQDSRLFRLHTLRFNDDIRAVFLTLQHKDEVCGWANSYMTDELASCSPGDLLLQHVISNACHNNMRHFDLGAGDADYKTRWLHDELPLAASIFGVTPKGRLAAAALGTLYGLKAAVKKSSLLSKLARSLGA